MHEHLTRWWNGISLRNKITGVTVVLLTLGLLVAGVGTMSVLRAYLVGENDNKVSDNAESLYNEVVSWQISNNVLTCTAKTGQVSGYFVGVLSPDGTVLCSNGMGEEGTPVLKGLSLKAMTAADLDGPFSLYNASRSSQWRVAAYIPNDHPVTVIVGINLDETNRLIASFVGIFLFFGLTVVILGGALTRLLVASTFAPLREVEQTAARFAAGDFSQRLGGATPNTEVGRLNESLNTMLSRVDSAFADRARTIDQMRRFVGDASHELRTPLVSVRGYAELYRMGALPGPEEVAQAMSRIEKEAIRMGELVADLLELARIDEAKPLNLAPVDLVSLAGDAALDAMASSPGRQVRVVVSPNVTVADDVLVPAIDVDAAASRTANPNATGPIAGFAAGTLARLRPRRRPAKNTAALPVVVVDERAATTGAIVLAEENKIRQVITNLMGNALRFTSTDSPIDLEVSVDRDRDVATIAVADHGEGIPPQIREKIFQRFWRADSSRNRDTGGSGLGLAIVASIVASHKGSVDVVETPGGGATFRVSLPLLHTEASTTAISPTDSPT